MKQWVLVGSLGAIEVRFSPKMPSLMFDFDADNNHEADYRGASRPHSFGLFANFSNIECIKPTICIFLNEITKF